MWYCKDKSIVYDVFCILFCHFLIFWVILFFCDIFCSQNERISIVGGEKNLAGNHTSPTQLVIKYLCSWCCRCQRELCLINEENIHNHFSKKGSLICHPWVCPQSVRLTWWRCVYFFIVAGLCVRTTTGNFEWIFFNIVTLSSWLLCSHKPTKRNQLSSTIVLLRNITLALRRALTNSSRMGCPGFSTSWFHKTTYTGTRDLERGAKSSSNLCLFG
jgi:hypothetical protein